jgi:hypothetical protein
MASPNQLNLSVHGKDPWNEWRAKNPGERPDLRFAQFTDFDFSGYDLEDADFRGATLRHARFLNTHLSRASFAGANLAQATFRGSLLDGSDFSDADLSGASFYQASLIDVNLTAANLFMTVFRRATFGGTILADVDLETAIGLEEIGHISRSSVSIDTLYRSSGNIPKTFLYGVGFPAILVDYIPSLVEADTGIRFHSCFISYSHNDEAFARRLWTRLRQERIRVWFAPEEMQGGKKLFDQIERAIHMHDKLLLVLSETSIKSNWVQTEIKKAREQEIKEGQRKLFPIRLMDMRTLQAWRCPDADTGRDLAADVREYFVPDFSNWLSNTLFEKAFVRLREDLRREGVGQDS